jgi:hypothetical protein
MNSWSPQKPFLKSTDLTVVVEIIKRSNITITRPNVVAFGRCLPAMHLKQQQWIPGSRCAIGRTSSSRMHHQHGLDTTT